MDYKKVPQQINDVVGDNVKKLAQLFPSAVKDGEVEMVAATVLKNTQHAGVLRNIKIA